MCAAITVSELRLLARQQNISGYSRMKKDELISATHRSIPAEFLNLRCVGPDPYIKLGQLGKPGKDGTVYLVVNPDSLNKCAMKTFRKKKSSQMIQNEAYFQYLASKAGISPAVICYDLENKFIVMEVLSQTLLDVLETQKGVLTTSQQKQIINLYHLLDKIGIMINDANPRNVMEKNGQFYLIDYGLAKYTSHPSFNIYQYPNFQLMPISLLELMKGRYPTTGWTYIRSQIDPNVYKELKIKDWI